VSRLTQLIRTTGQLTNLIVLGSSLVAMVVPLIIGQFFHSVGQSVVMTVIGIILLAAVGVLFSVLRRSQGFIEVSAGVEVNCSSDL